MTTKGKALALQELEISLSLSLEISLGPMSIQQPQYIWKYQGASRSPDNSFVVKAN